MNGPLMANVTSLETERLARRLAEAPYLDTPGRIETLYLAALTRRPGPTSWRSSVRSSSAADRRRPPRHLPMSSGPF